MMPKRKPSVAPSLYVRKTGALSGYSLASDAVWNGTILWIFPHPRETDGGSLPAFNHAE